jgi:hypothetical protein
MELGAQEEREIRAARNQSMFRLVNEKAKALNEAFVSLTDTHAVACECAETSCIEMIEIAPDEYDSVRSEPRRFVVRPGHVVPEVETVVRESPGYFVVEKFGAAGDAAESLAPQFGN